MNTEIAHGGFHTALDAAESGDVLLYFRGDLAERRIGRIPVAMAAEATGCAVWKAYENGLGVPLQRRNEHGFDYLFVKS